MRERKKNILWVLIKKQITQSLSFTKSKKSFDFFGTFLYIVLIGAIAYIFLSVFSGFIDVYCNVKFYGQKNFAARQYELLSIAYLVAFVLITFSSASAVNKTIFENEDIKIMTALPISSAQLFWSKMIAVYAKQIITSFIIIIPVNLAFAFVEPQPAYYYIMSAVICFIFPLLSISLAAVLALPIHFIKSFLSNKYLLVLIIISILTTLACAGYATLIDKVKYLIIKGEVDFILNESAYDFAAKLAKFSVPAKFFAALVLKQNVLFNFLVIPAIAAVCVLVSLVLINFILNKAVQNRLTLTPRPVKLFKTIRKKSVLSALMGKEFNTVFRTPRYTFLYFSMAVAMPVMAGLCMSMGISFIQTVIMSPVNFELALFLTLIFGVLTNTFCATNISRDGATFFTAKAMPVSIKQIILAKILLCMIVAFLSAFLSVLIFYIMSYVTLAQCLYIFGVASCLGFAQICFATRLDFNKPKFSSLEDGQIKDSNTTMSVIIVTGLIIAFLIGFLILYLSLMSFFKPKVATYSILTKCFVAVFSALLAFLSYKFLTKNLTKKYYEFVRSKYE